SLSAKAGYDLVTGLGSPKANLVVADLVAANVPPVVKSTTTLIPKTSAVVAANGTTDSLSPVPPPASNGSGNGSSSGSSSSSTTSIAPLGPNTFTIVATTDRGRIVVIVIP